MKRNRSLKCNAETILRALEYHKEKGRIISYSSGATNSGRPHFTVMGRDHEVLEEMTLMECRAYLGGIMNMATIKEVIEAGK